MERNIGSFIQKAVREHGNKTALYIRRGLRTEKYTYKEMRDWSLRFSTLLSEMNIHRGDMVLIWGPNMPEWVFTLLGCIYAGVVVVPVSVHSSIKTVDEYIKQTRARLLVQSKFLPGSSARKIQTIHMEDVCSLVSAKRRAALAQPRLDDLAEILYTSGTTGDPSGVMLTHRNILVGLAGLQTLIPPSREYRLLSVLPLSHSLEQLLGLLTTLSKGATLYYMPQVNPVVIAKSLKKYRITHLIVVPQLLKLMWNTVEYRAHEVGKGKSFRTALNIAGVLPIWVRRIVFSDIHANLGGTLKMCGCAGAPLDVHIARNWEKVGIIVIEGYGMTETSAAITANTIKERKLGSVGKIFPGIDLKISQEGELLTKGPNVTKGYFKDQQKTKEMFTDDGYIKTGDIGYIDSEGFVFLSGRMRFKIVIPTGEKVYPEDIERVLNKHEAVKDSCVVGIKDSDGERVFAAVVLKRNIPLEDVIAETNVHVESHQAILEYGAWPEKDLPRTRTLKLDRIKVKEWAESQVQKLQQQSIRTSEKNSDNLNTTRDVLKEILASVCNIDTSHIKESTRLVQDLNLDSLRRVAVVSLVEEEMGVDVDETEITEKTTVGDMRDIVSTAAAKPAIQETYVSWPLSKAVVEIREIVRRMVLFPILHFVSPSVRIQGEEWMKSIKSPSILIFNHVGHNEPWIIMKSLPSSIRKKQTALADPRSFRNPFRAFLMYFVGAAFPVETFGGSVRRSMEQAADLLEQGSMLVLSPEGERSRDGELQEFKNGAALLAVETGVPVYPVKVSGYREIYPVPGRDFDIPRRKGVLTLTFGRPLEFSRDMSYEDATKIMRDTIAKM